VSEHGLMVARFVGGPEDGKLHNVDLDQDGDPPYYVRFAEKMSVEIGRRNTARQRLHVRMFTYRLRLAEGSIAYDFVPEA